MLKQKNSFIFKNFFLKYPNPNYSISINRMNIRSIYFYNLERPRSSEPFYTVSKYIKWVTTSWTHSNSYGICTYFVVKHFSILCSLSIIMKFFSLSLT